MEARSSFSELVAEGAAEPVEGWDFSWFEGRATEERPSWGYSGLVAGRMGPARAALDVQTGGGEVLARTVPGFTVEGYRDRLARLHEVIRAQGPFVSHSQRFLIEAVKG
jgi:hypothetical protein